MSLAENRRLRIFTLCVLYVAQGIPWGFMATTLPAYLTERGLSFDVVTATLSLSYLPYAFKWLWGPVIDSFTLPRFGRRRPWIVLAQLMMALTVFAIVTLDVTSQVKLLAWMILIHTVFNALQDVAVDALAVELLTEDERGKANGLMYGSKYLGGAIGGAGMAAMTAAFGLDTALVTQTAILLAIMLVPLLVREREQLAAVVRTPARELGRALGQAFSLRSALFTAVLMLGMNFAGGVLNATAFQLYVKTLKWKHDEYAALSGGWGLLVGCLGALAGGFIADRLGRRRLVLAAAFGMAAGWALFALSRDHWNDKTIAYAFGLWEVLCQSIMTVGLVALCMDVSWPKIAGSQFTAYMALANFSTTLGYQAAPGANDLWQFHGVYLVAAAFQVGIALLVVAIDPTETRRKLPLPAVEWRGIAALLTVLGFLIVMTGYVTLQRLG